MIIFTPTLEVIFSILLGEKAGNYQGSNYFTVLLTLARLGPTLITSDTKMLGAVVFAPFVILDDGLVYPSCLCNNLDFFQGVFG